MSERRKVAVVTGTRAEFGLLTPILDLLLVRPQFELCLLVTGMHLLAKHGSTIEEIKRGGYPIAEVVPMYDPTGEEPLGHALATGVRSMTEALLVHRPDILLVLGDRLEPFAAVLAAATLQIPVAHIHGGDKIDSGHLDESVRHAMTKFAHLHFAASKQSAARLRGLGEEEWRIHFTGAPGLDTILNRPRLAREVLWDKLGLAAKGQVCLCIQHPVLLEQEEAGRQMEETLAALQALEMQVVLLYPNNDPGSRAMIQAIEEFAGGDWLHTYQSLPYEDYLSLLSYCDVFVGNSSSGILEAPAFRVPYVHVGTRNAGREHAENVVFAAYDRAEIVHKVREVLSADFQKRLQALENPYGDGQAAERMVDVLQQVPLTSALLRKVMTY